MRKNCLSYLTQMGRVWYHIALTLSLDEINLIISSNPNRVGLVSHSTDPSQVGFGWDKLDYLIQPKWGGFRFTPTSYVANPPRCYPYNISLLPSNTCRHLFVGPTSDYKPKPMSKRSFVKPIFYTCYQSMVGKLSVLTLDSPESYHFDK